MSTFRNPVGPQPGRVYWRRRIVLLLGILAVILIVVLILVRPGANKPTGTKTPIPSTSTQPSTPSTSTTPSPASTLAGGACNPSQITVVAITDAGTYAPGVNPKLSLGITNTGASACTFAVGTNVQEYKITSGSETIWSSKDCQTGATPSTVTLQPNAEAKNAPIVWDRTRSSKATCTSKRPQVIAKGASYHLSVTVNGVTSAQSKQFILN